MSERTSPLATGPRPRSPRELITLYWDEVWNKGRVELIPEICADPMIRHDVGRVTRMSHEDQIARVRDGHAMMLPTFTHEVLVADGEVASSVWNMTGHMHGEPIAICGIETFRVIDGRLAECWNSPYGKGLWGRTGIDEGEQEAVPPPLVDAIGEIDAAWLEQMYAAAGVKVPHIGMVTRAERVGNGTSTQVWRIHIGYNVAGSGGAPPTLIVKLPSAERPDSVTEGDLIGCAREGAAYRFLGDTPPMRIPRCYHAANEGVRFDLVIEDLGEDARPGDQIAGCSAEDAALVVRELAALHAAYWRSDKLDGLDWPMRMQAIGGTIAPFYAGGIEVLRNGAGKDWDAGMFELIEAVAPLVAPFLQSEPATTLIHGELRVDNVLFEADGKRACLIDLAGMSIGDPQRDLAYFLTGSLDPADRRACERALVADHAATIRAVDPDYSDEAAWDAYRANAIAGLIYTVAAARVIPETPHNAALLTALARRNVAAITDLDGIAAARNRF